MSEALKKRTKKFALDGIGLCADFPQVLETRHAIGQVIRSSSSVAANYRSACRGKSKADFISKPGTVEGEADETGFWLEIRTSAFELSQSVTIDWTLRKSARARIKVMVKRILNKPGYPPDLQEEAVKTVLARAELLGAEWV